MKEKIIWIWWWVWPMAWVDLHKKIIENTLSEGVDSGHLDIIHISRSSDITDRTAFLVDNTLENPAQWMFRNILALESSRKNLNAKMVFGVPCNTFHSPSIFNSFLELISKKNVNIQVLNMIEETWKHIQSHFPMIKKVGLMSTTWTRESWIYKDFLEDIGFKIIQVSDNTQKELHNSIYNKERWIKAISPTTNKAKKKFKCYCNELKSNGAEAIILWCTEIPLALPEKTHQWINLIDPTLILARALVAEANVNKLRKL